MKKTRVLFVCIHNSARSQMAQAFLNAIAGDRFIAESAGIEAGVLNPLAVKAMAEIGIDISHNTTQRAFDLLKSGRHFHYVITLCDAVNAQKCPVFPGAIQHIHWSFPAPGELQGTHDEKMKEVRKIRDSIRKKIESWISETKSGKDPEIEVPLPKFGES